MSTLEDIVQLIFRLSQENVQIATKAKELLAENERLKAENDRLKSATQKHDIPSSQG